MTDRYKAPNFEEENLRKLMTEPEYIAWALEGKKEFWNACGCAGCLESIVNTRRHCGQL